jgi:transposase
MQALFTARLRERTEVFKDTYRHRAGIEGVGVRALGVRRSRYLGLRKTHLDHVATATAMNVIQLTSWLRGEVPEQTRTSPFKEVMKQAAQGGAFDFATSITFGESGSSAVCFEHFCLLLKRLPGTCFWLCITRITKSELDPKYRKSARMVGIDRSEPEQSAPHPASSIALLEIDCFKSGNTGRDRRHDLWGGVDLCEFH